MSQENPEKEMVSQKIGPFKHAGGDVWSCKDLSEMVQIRISHDDTSSFTKYPIKSLQFLYLKDGQLNISEVIGDKSFSGPSFHTIVLDYPSEYITSVEGDYDTTNKILALSIETNRRTYGPFGKLNDARSFSYKFGPAKQFGGFHGYHWEHGLCSIGIYLNLPKLTFTSSGPRLCSKSLRQEPEVDHDQDDEDGDKEVLMTRID